MTDTESGLAEDTLRLVRLQISGDEPGQVVDLCLTQEEAKAMAQKLMRSVNNYVRLSHSKHADLQARRAFARKASAFADVAKALVKAMEE